MDTRQRRGASQPDVDGDPIATAVAAALATQEHTFGLLLDTQMKAFQACLQASMDSVNTRLDTFIRETVRDIAELRTSVQFSQNELRELNENVKKDSDRHRQNDQLVRKLTADFKQLDDTADYMENQARRNNLRVDGIKERGGETWEETERALRRVLEAELKMPADQVTSMGIERAHRSGGAPNADHPRTIVVKFTTFKSRDAVLQAARATKPRGVYVNEDFSSRVMGRRKELLPEMRAARERGKVAYLSYDRLVVKYRLVRQQ